MPSCRAACSARSGSPPNAWRSQISSATASWARGGSPAVRPSNSAVASSTMGTRSPETPKIGSCQPSVGGRCCSVGVRSHRDRGPGQRPGAHARDRVGAKEVGERAQRNDGVEGVALLDRSDGRYRDEHQDAQRRRREDAQRVRRCDDSSRKALIPAQLTAAEALECTGLGLCESDRHVVIVSGSSSARNSAGIRIGRSVTGSTTAHQAGRHRCQVAVLVDDPVVDRVRGVRQLGRSTSRS